MTFVSPIWLLGLLPVAATAVWTFVRPARRNVVVGSLALWRAAVKSDGGQARSVRRIPPGWGSLLLGATLGGLALGQPILHRETTGPSNPAAPLPSTAEPPITFDALSGEMQPDDQAEIFVRLRNNTAQTFTGSLTISPPNTTTPGSFTTIAIPPDETTTTIQSVPDSPTLTIQAMNDAGGTIVSEKLRKIQPGLTRIATTGDVPAVLHRYIQSDAWLALVASPTEADVILAQGTNPPKETTALILAPPSPPPGWREGKNRFAVTLDQTDVAADDPVMKDVHVSAMAVRRLPLWRSSSRISGKRLLQMDLESVIVRSKPENDPTSLTPRRVYVSFAITPDNTNMEDVPGPFVTLLANALRWLHPANDARGRFLREMSHHDTVIRNPEEPGTDAASASRTLELHPWLVVAAMVCWMFGWWRSRSKTT